jgi:hypothetical protein
MNDLEYLNQISAGVNQPAKTGLLDKKMKIVLAVLGGVVLLLIISLSVAGGSSKPEATLASELGRLYTRTNELNKTITTYNPSVHHSTLRSNGASFSTLLVEISSTSSSYLTHSLGVELGTIAVPESDSTIINNLNTSLENARLNGILDRKYASEMYYQIIYLLNLEDSVDKRTNDNTLKSFLESSRNSLLLLEDTFHNFSESD